MTLIMLGALFAAFYFILIRPQAKRAKEHKAMIAALAKGDEVVTGGGVLGRVTNGLPCAGAPAAAGASAQASETKKFINSSSKDDSQD